MKIRTKEVGGYEQGVRYEDNFNSIDDAWCTCRWGTIHRDAWRRGEKICHHLKEAIMQLAQERLNEIQSK